jgi:hypothetical protein
MSLIGTYRNRNCPLVALVHAWLTGPSLYRHVSCDVDCFHTSTVAGVANSDPMTSRIAAPEGRHLNDRQKAAASISDRTSTGLDQ